jgi:hypothetical protein
MDSIFHLSTLRFRRIGILIGTASYVFRLFIILQDNLLLRYAYSSLESHYGRSNILLRHALYLKRKGITMLTSS